MRIPLAKSTGKEQGMTLQQKIVLGARVVLGLMFFVSGIIGLLRLAEFPALTPQATSFIRALIQTGYLFPFTMAVQTVCGALLILGFFVPLVLLVLAPVIVNIVLYEVFLSPTGLGLFLGFGPLVLELGLAYYYRSAFLALFHIKAEPF